MKRLLRLHAISRAIAARRRLLVVLLFVIAAVVCVGLPAVAQTTTGEPPLPQTPEHMVPKGIRSWWLPPGHATHAPQVDALFTWIFWITMVVFVGVEVVLVWFMIKFRWRADRPKGVFIHGNTRLEMFWTLIPSIILAVIALASKRVWDNFRYEDPSKAAQSVNVLVVGEQFQWNFVYPGPDNKIGKYLAFPRPTDPPFRKYPAKEVAAQVNKAIGENTLGQFRPTEAVEAEVTAYEAEVTDLRSKLSGSAAAALDAKDREHLSSQLRTELAAYDRGMERLEGTLSPDAKIWRDTKDDDYVTGGAGTRPLVLPVDTPLNVWLSSKDVIHDFYMPNMRVKLDAVPGMRGEINFTATPSSQSTEVREVTDPAISKPGVEMMIWVDAHTAHAAKQPDGKYALVDPKDPAKVLATSLQTHATADVVQALTEAGITKVTVISKPWDLVCEELCGQGHATMRGEVLIVSKQQYWDFIHKPDVATTRPSGVAVHSPPATRPAVAELNPRR